MVTPKTEHGLQRRRGLIAGKARSLGSRRWKAHHRSFACGLRGRQTEQYRQWLRAAQVKHAEHGRVLVKRDEQPPYQIVGVALREPFTKAVADRELAVSRLHISRILAVIEQFAGEKAGRSTVGDHQVKVQRIAPPFQSPELTNGTRSSYRQIDQLEIVTIGTQPAFGYRSEGGLLADLRRFHHRIPEQAYSKGPCRLCKIALDIAQAK